MLLAEVTDLDAWGRLVNQVGFPISLFIFAAIALIWLARTYGPTFKDESMSRTTLNKTLTEHIPQQSDTLRILATQGSDFIREVHNTKEAAAEISYAMEALASDDSESKKKDVERYARRAREKLGLDRKKSSDSDS